MLANYLSIAHNQRYELTLQNMDWFVPYRPPQKTSKGFLFENNADIPLVCFSHNMPDFPEYRFTNKLALLIRHPFAMVMSRYFHIAYHAPDPEAGSMTDIFEFAMKGRDGLANTRGFLNGWATEIKARNGHVVTYERLLSEPQQTFEKFLTFCGIPVNSGALLEAVEKSGKTAMVEAERRDPFNDGARTDGRKARVHFVGAYDDYFSISQQQQMKDALMGGLTPDAHELLGNNDLIPQIFDLDEHIEQHKRIAERLAANPIMRD